MLKDRLVKNNENLTDFIPIFVGLQNCPSKHKFGPAIRDYYLIHFVFKGKGSITDPTGTYDVNNGELFIIRPGEVTTYIADEENPWSYVWIAFKGSLAKVFDEKNTVYICPTELTKRIFDYIQDDCFDAGVYTSILHELVYHLFYEKQKKDVNVSKIKQYVDYNYMNDLKVDEIAKIFGFERSYLFRIFKAKYGIGLKEYIVKVRTDWAKKFLADGYSVVDTSFMVGYRDEFNFSRGFKKFVGVSPMEYKKKYKKQQNITYKTRQ